MMEQGQAGALLNRGRRSRERECGSAVARASGAGKVCDHGDAQIAETAGPFGDNGADTAAPYTHQQPATILVGLVRGTDIWKVRVVTLMAWKSTRRFGMGLDVNTS